MKKGLQANDVPIPLRWHVEFENGIDTYFHHQFYLKNANLTVITPLEHTFLVDGLNSLYCM